MTRLGCTTAALLALLAGACYTPDDAKKGGPAGAEGVGTRDLGPAGPLDHPPMDPLPARLTPAGAQRLSVSQLAASFPVLFGKDKAGNDITWKVGQKSGFESFVGSPGTELEFAL